MDALLHRLLRPGRRATRGTVVLALVALVGWLGLSAGHLHLPHAPEGSAPAHAHVDDDGHGHATEGAAGHDDHGRGPCALCVGLERGAPAPWILAVPADDPVVGPQASTAAAPQLVRAVASVYRSRAPPSA